MTDTTLDRTTVTVADQILGWDHLEWWVGNARAVTAWLASGFGFDVLAYSGPETGAADRVSYLLGQGRIRFVVTAGLDPDGEIAAHVRAHGDGVRNLAWSVPDVRDSVETAATKGAVVVSEPATAAGNGGEVTTAAISTYGDTRLLFVDRSRWHEGWAPAFASVRLPRRPPGAPTALAAIDHVVGNVEQGRLDEWVDWYCEVLGFRVMRRFGADQISTPYSALRSTVVHNGAGVVMPINEPAPGLRRSQIDEYLDAYRGPGVQHIALSTADIIGAVGSMHERGVRFLDMPETYYEDARCRVTGFHLPWAQLQQLGIEVDVDSGGYLLQVFTETVSDRPTLFVEVIQREGATGFGEGNFKALFEAIEREQARRGNL